ncbi:DUF389 domain-containing protein [Streptacidiphilus sp. PB12-B1b]|nr:DUF389 domain-containing protein [Streptacidiphilus sp. PB12-B1b]
MHYPLGRDQGGGLQIAYEAVICDGRVAVHGHPISTLPLYLPLSAIIQLFACGEACSRHHCAEVAAPRPPPGYALPLTVTNRCWNARRQGLLALLGFLLAIVATFLFSLLIRAFGLQSEAFTLGVRPVSTVINTPDFFSFAVAGLAGIVGIVSLTEARTSTLLGGFISVTTIPAAADTRVSTAFTSWREDWGSLVQLLLDIVVLAAFWTTGAQQLFSSPDTPADPAR